MGGININQNLFKPIRIKKIIFIFHTGCLFETLIYDLFITDGYFKVYEQKHMAKFSYGWDILINSGHTKDGCIFRGASLSRSGHVTHSLTLHSVTL